MKLISFALLFLVPVAVYSAAQCHFCYGQYCVNGTVGHRTDNCNDYKYKAAGMTCATRLEDGVIVDKGCQRKDVCQTELSFKDSGRSKGTKCCNKNLCNDEIIILPPPEE